MGGDTVQCNKQISSSIQTVGGQTVVFRDKTQTYTPDALYTVRAFIAEHRKYTNTVVSGQAYISPLKSDNLFSNLNASKLLYYAGDMGKMHWTALTIEQSLQNLRNLIVEFEKIELKLLVVIVPDKSTAYLKELNDSPFKEGSFDIWEKLGNAGLPVPNLKRIFLEKVRVIQDFYLPNDTHLSQSGYLTLAQEISKLLR